MQPQLSVFPPTNGSSSGQTWLPVPGALPGMYSGLALEGITASGERAQQLEQGTAQFAGMTSMTSSHRSVAGMVDVLEIWPTRERSCWDDKGAGTAERSMQCVRDKGLQKEQPSLQSKRTRIE